MTAPKPTPPRIPLLDAPEDPLARELFEELVSQRRLLNLHRMMAHAPALLKASNAMAMAFRKDTKLARPLVELVILRTAQVTKCDYVFERHLPHARACGVSERQIEELARFHASAAFTLAQKAALDFAEKAAQRLPVDEAAFAPLRRDFSPREIVEITMLVGFYVSTAILIKTLGVPDEGH
jgi:AhpD family alkylhydroperoxidase